MFYNNVEAAFYQCSFGRSSRKKPGYVKFTKDLVTKKRSVTFEDDDRIQYCGAIVTRSLVQKKEDLGAFTIPCTVGSLHFRKHYVILGQA